MTSMTATTTRSPVVPRSAAVVRNASALMLSTVASAAVGFLFWVVAARWFAPSAVGIASAVVSSMTLLAAIAQLNLTSLFARFLPTAGVKSREIIIGGASASILMSLAGTACFVWWGLADNVIGQGGWVVLLFGTGVVVSALYFVVDGVLTAFGRAGWVPTKNVATSAAKLALLVVFGTAGLAGGSLAMLVAWVVPVVATVLVLGFVVLRRLAPSHASATTQIQSLPTRREVAGFVSAEYVNGIISNVTAFVPPVLVALVLGPANSAYFYIPWLIGVSGTTMLWNIVMSFVVAASGDSGSATTTSSARAHLRRAIRLGGLVAGGGAVLLVVAATPLLALVGPAYASQGATALRLIGLALPFTAVILLYAAFCVMDKRMWRLTAFQFVGAVLFLGLGWFGLVHYGMTAAAIAYLVAQVLVAVVVAPAVIRRYRNFGEADRSLGGASGG
jgi:O-antigen/teichoic acid export membrane protein